MYYDFIINFIINVAWNYNNTLVEKFSLLYFNYNLRNNLHIKEKWFKYWERKSWNSNLFYITIFYINTNNNFIKKN